MKKLLFAIALFIAFQINAQDDMDYVMYSTIELTPKDGHYMELMEGLKAHNAKYHSEGWESVNVWNIVSGPRSGKLNWVMGPHTWTHLDKAMEDDHLKDWLKHVSAHAEMGEWGYWRLNSDLSYMPENFQTKLMFIRFFDIESQKGDNAEHLFSTIISTYKENKMDMGLQVFQNVADAGDGKEWAVIWYHDSYASMDKDRNFRDKYEKKYGDDSWAEFFEGWREATDFEGIEIQELMPDLGVAGGDN